MLSQQQQQQQKQKQTDGAEMRESLAYKMKNGEPVLFEVGKLGKDYQDWVHSTRVNKMLRFFHNDYLELTSYCPWWTVPLVWIPVACCFLYHSSFGFMDTVRYYLAGVAAWPVLEYALHRFVFHMHTETYVWNTLHFVMHGNHHVSPNDYLRLVFPPVPASIIASIIGSIIVVVIGWDVGLNLMAGLLSGYVCYDVTHFALHSTTVPKFVSSALRDLKIHHYQHHRAVDSAFGITTVSLDNLLGTTEAMSKE